MIMQEPYNLHIMHCISYAHNAWMSACVVSDWFLYQNVNEWTLHSAAAISETTGRAATADASVIGGEKKNKRCDYHPRRRLHLSIIKNSNHILTMTTEWIEWMEYKFRYTADWLIQSRLYESVSFWMRVLMTEINVIFIHWYIYIMNIIQIG